MTPKEQVARLESLLARVQQNASKPRERSAPDATAFEPQTLIIPRQASPAAPAPRMPEPPAEPIMLSTPAEETTLVRAIDPSFADEAHVVEVEELLEDEIVDITDIAEEAPSGVIMLDDEELPASSRRPIAANMSEALAEAAEAVELDEGREIPLKTPPPESGPQEAPPVGLAAPPVPDIEEIVETDIMSRPQPTTEQLGATVELESAPPVELELSPPPAPTPARAPEPRPPAPPPPAPPPEPVRPEV